MPSFGTGVGFAYTVVIGVKKIFIKGVDGDMCIDENLQDKDFEKPSRMR
jgi:hypothetical protein